MRFILILLPYPCVLTGTIRGSEPRGDSILRAKRSHSNSRWMFLPNVRPGRCRSNSTRSGRDAGSGPMVQSGAGRTAAFMVYRTPQSLSRSIDRTLQWPFLVYEKRVISLAGLEGFEPSTSGLEARRYVLAKPQTPVVYPYILVVRGY